MIVSYPNYLDQTQSIGLDGIISWHGESGIAPTPFPLCITIGKQTEYGITTDMQTEYGITTDMQTEYGITISHGGCS